MNRTFEIVFFLILSIFHEGTQAQDGSIMAPKTIFVANPTGIEANDREAILSALKKANEGDTVQFAVGHYQIGKKIQLAINGITMRGGLAGTVISGCKPENFQEHLYGILNCGGFELIGQNQTIENFIFEYAWHGLMIGCCLPDGLDQLESGSNIKEEQFGGHLVRRNIFRFNSTGIRVMGNNPETVVVQDNVFQDNFHGLTINGSNVLVKENRFYRSTPEKIPVDGAIDNAIGVFPFSSMFPPDNQPESGSGCEKIEIVGNTIEGIKNGIMIGEPNTCASVLIKDNVIEK